MPIMLMRKVAMAVIVILLIQCCYKEIKYIYVLLRTLCSMSIHQGPRTLISANTYYKLFFLVSDCSSIQSHTYRS
jgi:hypothetical protein